MPEIYRFLGIIITMYPLGADHNPPHIHARYGEYDAKFDIETFKLIDGSMPNNKTILIKEFIEYHKDELLKMWSEQKIHKIKD